MQKAEPVRVFLICPHRLSRAALCALLKARENYEVVGEADSCADAIKAVPTSANLLLIDLPDGEFSSLRDVRRVLAAAPKARPLVITPPVDTATRTQIVRLGALGLITKDESADLLFTAMETVAHKHVAWIDRATMTEVLRTIGEPSHDKPGPTELLASLTRRERDIVNTTLLGLKNRQVADRLFISETTVRHHLTSIFSKLGVRDRFELLRFAYQHGLATRPDRAIPKSG
ncbi:MAG TPA: response regulator transcription factor [Thermoanaerobaculia bacterium]